MLHAMLEGHLHFALNPNAHFPCTLQISQTAQPAPDKPGVPGLKSFNFPIKNAINEGLSCGPLDALVAPRLVELSILYIRLLVEVVGQGWAFLGGIASWIPSVADRDCEMGQINPGRWHLTLGVQEKARLRA